MNLKQLLSGKRIPDEDLKKFVQTLKRKSAGKKHKASGGKKRKARKTSKRRGVRGVVVSTKALTSLLKAARRGARKTKKSGAPRGRRVGSRKFFMPEGGSKTVGSFDSGHGFTSGYSPMKY